MTSAAGADADLRGGRGSGPQHDQVGERVRACQGPLGDRQFVAFYDADRQLTVAARTLDSRQWQLVRLPTRVGWDDLT